MTASKQAVIGNIPTGVPGMDAVLGGGLCEYSFNLVAGPPGAGKTTLVQQIFFANATTDCPGLYFTVLGEPTASTGPHAGQRWVYFLAPWGMQFELVSYPGGKAFDRQGQATP